MSAALLDELRERVGLRSVLVWLGVLAVLRAVFDASLPQLAVTAATGAILGLSEAVGDAYGLRPGVRRLGFAVVTLVSGGALLAFGDGEAWLPVGVLLVGAWLLLDGVQTLRHDGLAADDARDGEAVYREYVVRRVYQTLDERARTRRELSEALDADDEDVDRALDALWERGLLDRAGSELRLASSERSGLATAREKLGDGASRVLRPVTLEREEE